MSTETQVRRRDWLYNVAFGQVALVIAACAPDTVIGRIVQLVLLFVGGFAIVQAGVLKQMSDGGLRFGVSEMPRWQVQFDFIMACCLMGAFVVTDRWFVKLAHAATLGAVLFVSGMAWRRYQSQLIE